MTGPRVVLVPTPIGHLADITLRGLELLRAADVIAAEDTRHTSKLLAHYEIRKPLVALHMHNEHQRVQQLLLDVQSKGQVLAVVSDAGTPGISDPGYLVVREALALQLAIECLPGPTALIPALVLSGLPAHRFAFEGFLPVKKGRHTRLQSLLHEPRTMIFYESPFRVNKTLADLIQLYGPERPAAAVRELSKIHEQALRGTLHSLHTHFNTQAPKGEFVLLVAGSEYANLPPDEEPDAQ